MVDSKANVYIISNVNGGRGMIVTILPEFWGQSVPVFVQSTSYFAMESTHHDPASKNLPVRFSILCRLSLAITELSSVQ